MLETAIVATTTLFATVGPIDIAAVFAALSGQLTVSQRRQLAIRAVSVASFVLFVFALFGEFVLSSLGISMAALKTAGGVILLLIGINMVFARQATHRFESLAEQSSSDNDLSIPSDKSATKSDAVGHHLSPDISVFPLAMPLIAGPGSMGALIVLMQNSADHWSYQLAVLASLILIMLVTLLCLLTAVQLQQRLGSIGIQVIARVMGVILSALAIQFLFDGIAESGLLA